MATLADRLSALAGIAAMACLAATLAAGCSEPIPFSCDNDGQCLADGVAGVCEGDGYCSFPDPACATERRYGEHSPADRREACVPVCALEVTLGAYHGCLRRADGRVMCWGDNRDFKLGQNAQLADHHVSPVLVPGSSAARMLAAGDNHTCALANEKAIVACWGKNADGQLGNSGGEANPTPQVVRYESAVTWGAVELAAGASHTCARTGISEAVCWGDNDFEQLGDSSLTGEPVKVVTNGAFENADGIFAGGNSSCALVENDADKKFLACWGGNGSNQFCKPPPAMTQYPNEKPMLLPLPDVSLADVGADSLCAVSRKSLICCGAQQLNVPAVAIDDIAVGRVHTCILADGAVSCVGKNGNGQLGQGDLKSHAGAVSVSGLPPIVQLEAGRDTTCALTAQGAIYCWGDNGYGQANPYDTAEFITTPSAQVGSKVSCAVP